MHAMTMAQLDKKISHLVEQKLLEFLGDPDANRELKKNFTLKLRKRLKTHQKLVPMTTVAREYGIR